jgi:hypothetical protein
MDCTVVPFSCSFNKGIEHEFGDDFTFFCKDLLRGCKKIDAPTFMLKNNKLS